MDIQQITTTSEEAGKRLDAFLASQLADISRTRIQKAIEDGDVLVNDRAAKPSYKLRVGDQIDIDFPEPAPVEIVAEPIPLHIIYEDDDLIVVDKPAGMIV